MKEEIIETIKDEIKRVGIILLIAIFGITLVTVFALVTRIDRLENKIERLK